MYNCTSHFFKVERENVSWYGRYLIIAHVHFINTGPQPVKKICDHSVITDHARDHTRDHSL